MSQKSWSKNIQRVKIDALPLIAILAELVLAILFKLFESVNEVSVMSTYKTHHGLNQMPLKTRKGENAKFWFRSDRFLVNHCQWYFTTRDCDDVGPYENKKDAKRGLELFIECIERQAFDVEYAKSIALKGKWAIVSFK